MQVLGAGGRGLKTYMSLFDKLGKNKLANRMVRISDSGLFHREWYVNTYADHISPGQDPLDHYLKTGEHLGFKPNLYFDPDFYDKKAKVTKKFRRSLLEHYLEQSSKKRVSPSKLFSTKLYIAEYPKAAESGLSALSYHFKYGQYEGNAVFHNRLHNETLPSGRQSHEIIAELKLISKSGLFDESWYINFYPDIRNKDGQGLLHFILNGASEGRQPNPVFDTDWYRQEYMPAENTENPLINYITGGISNQRNPAENFISKDYDHPDFLAQQDKNKDPLRHFLIHSYKQGKKWPKPKPKPTTEGKSHRALVHKNLRALIENEIKPLAPEKNSFFKNALKLHWVVPDFAKGGGGHMTIFRMVSFLEQFGHEQTIWINNPSEKRTDENGYDDIQKYFQFFSGDVKILDDRFTTAQGDAIIATDCWTVWPTLSATNFHRRFYFVQDFEPSFHPMGAFYLAAEETYKQDLDCICASPWLAGLMEEKYGRWAKSFWLAADTKLYHPSRVHKKNDVPRIAFYARHFTARRAVELGLLALEVLAERGVAFKVDFFGAELGKPNLPFTFKDHGVASPDKLADIFQKADIGVVFSATNYSLVPQEMMACGLPIVELDGESTRCIFPEDTVTLAAPMPTAIADAMQELLASPEKHQKQREAALNWVRSFSWEQSAKIVEASLLERLQEFAVAEPLGASAQAQMKASVIIPTYNAGAQFENVLKATVEQVTPWPFEILVIDSGSTDETLEIIEKFPNVKLHQINSKDFSHGGTRNLGVELTSGEFIAFLTHDALPADERWLYKLVTSLEQCPDAAGVFGKHLAYPEASPFTKRDLEQHFENFEKYPLVLNRDTDKRKYANNNQGWRQLLHFYSDNNSCMRRSVWEKLPYRSIKFGEDQVWADDIIQAGYSKVYSPRARVFHSHDFSPKETFDRAKTEAAFFKHFFGYLLLEDAADFEAGLKSLNKTDTIWAEDNNISPDALAERLKDNEARLKGYLAGAEVDTDDMF